MNRLQNVGVMRGPLSRWSAVLACVAGLAGCGNLTAGGFGSADAYMTADGDQPSPSPSASTGEAPAPNGSSRVEAASISIMPGGLEGTLDVTASVQLASAEGIPYALTNGAVQVSLDLGGADEPMIGHAPVPAGVFDSLRVVFSEVSANVTGGLSIDGVPFTGAVTVDLGAAALEWSVPVASTLEEGGTASFLIDLHAAQWVSTLDPLTGIVTVQAFEEAVTATSR